MAAIREIAEARRERLSDTTGAVVFGRIDQEAGPRYYIGPNLIQERAGVGEPLVISFMAPVAAPYYTAGPEDPQGLRLRRRFQTKAEELQAISDELFGEGIEQEPTLDDLLLGELARNRTSEMRQIAATIQREQYAIITSPSDSTTIVQGGPGTGKTVVGLHRAALVLYRERERGAATTVLVLGPNPLFMQYIRYVLPSLGERTAEQRAISELGPVTSNIPADPLVARVKADPRMVEVLRRAVRDRVRVPTEPVELSRDQVRFKISPERIAALVNDFDPADESYNAARLRFRTALDELALQAYGEEVRRRGIVPDQITASRLDGLDQAKDRIWPAITAPELLRQLLSSEERLERNGGELSESERRLLFMRPVERLDQVRWTRSDVALADEVEFLLDRRPVRYGHVIIDETQDLTPMELRMVARRIRNGAITALGDLAQATGLWKHDNWDEIAELLGIGGQYTMAELRHAYRVPSEIMEIALPVLDLTAPSIEPPIAYRSGDAPVWLELAHSQLIPEVVSLVSRHDPSDGTAAIIAPPTLLPALRIELSAQGVDFGDAEFDQLAASVELLDPSMAKGLEFDHVYLVEPTRISREGHEDRRFQELYVALTRATRTLTILHSETLRWPLTVSRPRD